MLFVVVLKTFGSPVHVSFVPAQQDLGLHDAGTNLLFLCELDRLGWLWKTTLVAKIKFITGQHHSKFFSSLNLYKKRRQDRDKLPMALSMVWFSWNHMTQSLYCCLACVHLMGLFDV